MKRSIRWQAALLCLALLLPMLLLSACGRNLPVVMEYGTVRLEEDVYRYWLSCYRAQFAYDETEENIARLSELADLNIRKTVVAAALFDSYGLRFDEVARARIEAAMERLVENAGGTREQLDEAAAVYGIDYTGLKLAISYEQKASALYQYLFGSNGIYEIPVLQYENYYQKTYTHVKMVYIPYVDFLLDDDGERIWDAASGSYLYAPKTGASLSAQQAKATAVRQAISDGMSEKDFDALIEAYGEDPSTKTYKDGYYFSSEMDYRDYLPTLTEAALDLEEGEVGEVQSAYGVHFLLALPCEKGAYDKEAYADFFEGFTDRVAAYFYEAEVINPLLTEVMVHREVKEEIRYAEIEPNFDLYW